MSDCNKNNNSTQKSSVNNIDMSNNIDFNAKCESIHKMLKNILIITISIFIINVFRK